MKRFLKQQIDGLLSLAYPEYCSACGNTLYSHERNICGICRNTLPKTHFHTYADNPASRLFWGKVLIRSASSYYYFRKGDKVQHLIHQLKYKGEKEVGETVGLWYGEELRTSGMFEDVDLILPVPLHKDKLRIRGYNQSESFARGLSRSLHSEVDIKSLERLRQTDTQTRKSVFDRHENVGDVFRFHPLETPRRHLLVVDDVLTTGSTLVGCVQSIRNVLGDQNTAISVATIAFAKK